MNCNDTEGNCIIKLSKKKKKNLILCFRNTARVFSTQYVRIHC